MVSGLFAFFDPMLISFSRFSGILQFFFQLYGPNVSKHVPPSVLNSVTMYHHVPYLSLIATPFFQNLSLSLTLFFGPKPHYKPHFFRFFKTYG